MKVLRLLNTICLLLIFTPFFQMCTDGRDNVQKIKPAPQGETYGLGVPSEGKPDTHGDQKIPLHHPNTLPEKFWQMIVMPGDNFTVTAFGLIVLTSVNLIDGSFGEIWLGSVFAVLSISLTVITLIRLLRLRLEKIISFQMANVIVVLGMLFCAFLSLQAISQIKWGAYAYGISHIILLITFEMKLPRRNIIPQD